MKYLYSVVDERAGDRRIPLLAVSIHLGVVPRSSVTEDLPRAEDLSAYKVCISGDIVLNRMRAFQGAIGLSPVAGLVSPDYLVLRPNSKVSPAFLHHLFRSTWFVGEMISRLRGIGGTETGSVRTPRINASDLGDIEVELPPLEEQRAIADFLDVETARIDALIDKKRRLITLLDERFEAEVFHSVTRGLDRDVTLVDSGIAWAPMIPAHWGAPPVSANFDLQLGKMLNAEAADGPDQYPYLRNVNVQWDQFSLDDLATMHFSEADRRRCELRPGDVLVCEGGEVGRAAVWNDELDDCYFQKAIHRVRPLDDANGRFLMYCLRAAAKNSVFAIEGNQSTIVHLTGEQLRAHRFPWPPPREQAEIVDQLDQLADVHRTAAGKLTQQIALLEEKRQALITAAVTGEFAVPGSAAA